MNKIPPLKIKITYSELLQLRELVMSITKPETPTVQALIAKQAMEHVEYRVDKSWIYQSRNKRPFTFRLSYLESLVLIQFFLRFPPENFGFREPFFRNLQASILEFYRADLTG